MKTISKPDLNTTQKLGVFLIGLALFVGLGGLQVVTGWGASTVSKGVHIYVRDAATSQHIPPDMVGVRVTGFSFMGNDYPASADLRHSKTDPVFWSFSSNLATIYYVTVSADGYLSYKGKVSMPVNYVKEYTFKLTPEPEDDEVIPEPAPIIEEPAPNPAEITAEVYLNDAPVSIGDAIELETSSLTIQVVFTEGGSTVQQLWATGEGETRYYFDKEGDTWTAEESLEPGSADVRIQYLSNEGKELTLSSFSIAYAVDEAGTGSDSIQDQVNAAIGGVHRFYALITGSLGAGVFILGSIRRED